MSRQASALRMADRLPGARHTQRRGPVIRAVLATQTIAVWLGARIAACARRLKKLHGATLPQTVSYVPGRQALTKALLHLRFWRYLRDAGRAFSEQSAARYRTPEACPLGKGGWQ
jgi:hypothetical protein